MPRASVLSERRRQQRIDAIVDVALAQFTERGYGATTMAAIAEAVNLTPTALYRYFPSKQALLEYCLQERLQVHPLEDDEALKATFREPSFVQELRGRALLSFDIMSGQPGLWALMVREALAQEPDAVARYADLRETWWRRMRKIMDLHPGAKSLDEETKSRLALAASFFVLGATIDMMLAGRSDGRLELPIFDGPADPHALVEGVLDLILRQPER